MASFTVSMSIFAVSTLLLPFTSIFLVSRHEGKLFKGAVKCIERGWKRPLTLILEI